MKTDLPKGTIKYRRASPEVLLFRRAQLEARIEELIALLDLLDGDENLEPYLADSDPDDEDREDDDEREPEETDENGDEQDCCQSEDEWRLHSGDLHFNCSGERIARRMLQELQVKLG